MIRRLTHFVLHELGELGGVVAAVDDVLEEELLLHLAQLLLRVLVLRQGAPRHGHPVRIHVELLGFFLLLLDHCLFSRLIL